MSIKFDFHGGLEWAEVLGSGRGLLHNSRVGWHYDCVWGEENAGL